jgi:glycosyltransferase involved in cell wall biosynthesis
VSMSKSLKVLVCSDSWYPPRGGGDISMRLLSRALVRDGHRVSTCYIGDASDPELHSHPQPISTVFRGLWPRMWSIESRWRSGLRRVLDKDSPDIVLAQQTVIGPTLDACKSNGVPVAVFLQNVDLFCLGSFWSGHPWKCRYRCLGCKDSGPRLTQYAFFLSHIRRFRDRIRSADFVVSNSDFTKRTFKELFGIDSSVIAPLTDSVGRPAPLDPKGKILFFSPVSYKGVDIALRIASAMKDEEFLFVGNAKERMANRIRHVRNVEYVPWVKDTSDVYSKAKLLMVPSVIPEGYGMVCIEAMSRGIPCVVSGVGALPETVGAGGDSVASHKDLAPWLDALRRYSDHGFLQEKSRAALTRYSSYSPQSSINAVSDLLSNVEAKDTVTQTAR